MKVLEKKYTITCGIAMTIIAVATLGYFNHNHNTIIDDTPHQLRRQLKAILPQTVIHKRPLLHERKNPEEIIYAAFGASVTWGSGLIGDRDVLAYPKLLSRTARNLAIRATGPNYPSACTQTMVGDDNFDVIILEYFADVKQGLPTLTRRLRERFPEAIIIILREWWPLAIKNQDGLTVRRWAEINGFGRMGVHDPVMHDAFRKSNDIWSFPEQNKNRIFIQEKVAHQYGAHILSMPEPKDLKDWVDYAHLFADDFHHKSNEGHAEVAERVRELVERLGVPKNPKRNPWVSMDACSTWFDSGHVTGIRASPKWSLNQFSDRHKFALELESNATDGSITVENPSDKTMNLYIAYMITSPAPSKYPRTSVTIINNEKKKQEPIILEQVGPDYYGDNYIHVHVMEKIGSIPPGKTVMSFNPLERSEWPFRIVSVAITNEELSFAPGQPVDIRPPTEFEAMNK